MSTGAIVAAEGRMAGEPIGIAGAAGRVADGICGIVTEGGVTVGGRTDGIVGMVGVVGAWAYTGVASMAPNATMAPIPASRIR